MSTLIDAQTIKAQHARRRNVIKKLKNIRSIERLRGASQLEFRNFDRHRPLDLTEDAGMKWTVALAIISWLACTTLRAEDAKVGAEFFEKLRDSTQAEAALLKYCENIERPKIKKWPVFVPAVYVKTVESTIVKQNSGRQIAVVKVNIHAARCGNGCYDGGIESPRNVVSATTYANSVLIFNSSGEPEQKISSDEGMAVIDATNSGRRSALINYATYTDYESPPFLKIFDLTRPNTPAMLSLIFNPHLTKTPDEILTDETLTRAWPHATRFSRWSFAPHTGATVPDVLIEEKKDGKYAEVARFVFNAKESKWIGPPGSDDDVWKIGESERGNLKIEELKAADLPLYKKFNSDINTNKSKKMLDDE